MYHCFLIDPSDESSWYENHTTYHAHVAVEFMQHWADKGHKVRIEYDASDWEVTDV